MAEPTTTPLAQTIELRVTGQPEVKNKHGIGYVKPTHVHLRYATDGIHAQLYGLWRRTDTLSREGELTDERTDQGYDAPAGDMTGWPDWLANLAREHGPAGQKPQRGDGFEAWLKTQRDEHRDDNRGRWSAYDDLLDLYRLHADMGVPLNGHVCEARVVGDCECLEATPR